MMGIIIFGAMSVFIVVALLVIALGASRPKGRLVDVRVLSCEPKMLVDGENIKFYEVKVEFYGSDGQAIAKILQSGTPYMPGDVIRCRYQKDTGLNKTGLLIAETAPEVQAKTKNSVLVFLIVFLVFVGIIVAVIWGKMAGKELPEETGPLFGYFISIVFMAVGAIGVWRKHQMKQKMQDMISLPGVQVDYTISFSMDSDGRDIEVYHPVYEYQWGGERKRFSSSFGASTKKYRTIGRKVHIFVEPQTGKAICQEDEKTRGLLHILFGVAGIAVFALMLAQSFGVL